MNLPPAATSIFAVGAPLALAAPELFHPHPRDLAVIGTMAWLVVPRCATHKCSVLWEVP
jgi:hypothetical protein